MYFREIGILSFSFLSFLNYIKSPSMKNRCKISDKNFKRRKDLLPPSLSLSLFIYENEKTKSSENDVFQ